MESILNAAGAVKFAMSLFLKGYREIPGVAEGTREDKDSWREFLRYLKGRGVKGVRPVISDKPPGLIEDKKKSDRF